MLAWAALVLDRMSRPPTKAPAVNTAASPPIATQATLRSRLVRRTTKNATGPTNRTYTARNPMSQVDAGSLRPLPRANELLTSSVMKVVVFMSRPVTSGVGSTASAQLPRATAPATARTCPRPAVTRPASPGCHASGRPSTGSPTALSTTRWPPVSIQSRMLACTDSSSPPRPSGPATTAPRAARAPGVASVAWSS